MQKSQPRILCSVLWLAIVAIIVIALLVPTYRLNESFEGEFVAYGESYPATAELSVTYRRDPFFGEYKNEGKLSFITDAPDDVVSMVQNYVDLYLNPDCFRHVLWNPRFHEIVTFSWRNSEKDYVRFSGFTDSDAKALVLNDFKGNYSFAGRTCGEEEAAKIFDYLNLWYGFKETDFTENPFSHTPLVDRETAIATRTETPTAVLFTLEASDFLSDCWEYLLIGAVALVALLLSHWFPQIYLNHWILDALHEGRSGAKKYLNHSRICFTAMGLVVPLFACLAHFFDFYVAAYWLTSGVVFFVAMIAAIIALLVLLHRRAWIPITTQP